MMTALSLLQNWNEDAVLLWKNRLPKIPLWIIGTVVALGITGTAAYAAVGNEMGICHGGQAMLSYAWYNKRGDIVDRTYKCGKPHVTCKIRDLSAENPVYDCSSFVLPKGTVSWR